MRPCDQEIDALDAPGSTSQTPDLGDLYSKAGVELSLEDGPDQFVSPKLPDLGLRVEMRLPKGHEELLELAEGRGRREREPQGRPEPTLPRRPLQCVVDGLQSGPQALDQDLSVDGRLNPPRVSSEELRAERPLETLDRCGHGLLGSGGDAAAAVKVPSSATATTALSSRSSTSTTTDCRSHTESLFLSEPGGREDSQRHAIVT